MSISLFGTVILLATALLALPLVVLGTECFITLLPVRKKEFAATSSITDSSYRILMPAHNEAAILGQTLPRLISELPDANPERIVLVADNCSDSTADIARSLGVTVFERQDGLKRGKGFALEFGLQHIKESGTPEILIIIDADCETSKESLCSLIRTAKTAGQPVQMAYLMRTAKNASPKQRVAGFAWLLKNQIRPLALDKLDLPAALSGTGMGFPWPVVECLNMGNSSIVENMDLTLDCILKGFTPLFCSSAVIYSDFPVHSAAEITQRTRWEHGHLASIFQQFPVLMSAAWRQKDWRLLLLALDISVPPLSLLVTIAAVGLMALFPIVSVTGNALPFFALLFSLAYFVCAIGLAWFAFGRSYLTLQELVSIPQYILNKIPLYFGFLFNRQKEWIRTGRNVPL